MITSSQNKTIKDIKALSRKRERTRTGFFVAEGLRFVEAAIQCGADIEVILYSSAAFRTVEGQALISGLLKDGRYRVYEVDDKLFSELSDTQSPQGILAVVKQPAYDWSDVMTPEGLVVVLDRIQDPGNLGTIVRTADAAGASGIVLLKGSVDPYNPKVLRSTMGSVFTMPVIESADWTEVAQLAREGGYLIAATSLEDSVDYDEPDYRGPTVLVIGNEANGISREILDVADVRVKIPIVGSAESLNAGVAAAVMMYEVLRQRRN